MKFPLFRKDGNEEDEIHWIDLTEEVTHFSHFRNKIEVHTKDDVFIMPSTLEDWRRVLKEDGFEKLDVGNIVNMKMIKFVDEVKQKVYFEYSPNKSSKYADVARVRLSKLSSLKANNEKDEE